jgi:hypothetical protein
MKIAVVVPTIREKCIQDFLSAWREEFSDAHILVVEDNPTRTFDLSGYRNVTHFSWEDIDRDLGKDSWIIPRRTDCVRSYGYFKAYQEQPDMIVTLDDDCYPTEDGGKGFLARHWERLNESGNSEAWRETGKGVVTRGVPYFNRTRKWRVMINHGLWNRIPDFDAPTQLVQTRYPREFQFENQTIPVGMYFPMCGMNVAFRPEVVPALYFMLMGKDYEYDRFGDIWAGIMVKKICDHLGFAVNSGDPVVLHERASNVWANLRKEVAGLEVNEHFWALVDGIVLRGGSFGDCYKEIAQKISCQNGYWKRLSEAMLTWVELFE